MTNNARPEPIDKNIGSYISSGKWLHESEKGKAVANEYFNFEGDIDFINSVSGKNLVGEYGIEKTPQITKEIVRWFMLKYQVILDDYTEVLLNRFALIELHLHLGNKCAHHCKDYCILKGNPNGESIKIEDYVKFLDKYKDYFKYVREFSFLGQEIFTMDNMEVFFEEALKKGINNFSLTTRGAGNSEKNAEAVEKLKNLKIKYPQFNIRLRLSMDDFSSIYKDNHEAMIVNYYEILKLAFLTFGQKKININFVGTVIKANNVGNMDPEFLIQMSTIFVEIINRLSFDNIYPIKKTEFPDKNESHLKLNNKRKIITSFGYRKNTYDEEKLRETSLNKTDTSTGTCKVVRSPYVINIDSNFDITECYGFHGMFHKPKKRIVNTLDTDIDNVLKTVIESRKKFWEAIGYEDLLKYYLNHEQKYLCEPI